MKKKSRIIYLILVLGIWTVFLGATLRDMTWSDPLLAKNMIIAIGFGYAILSFYGWVLTEERRGAGIDE